MQKVIQFEKAVFGAEGEWPYHFEVLTVEVMSVEDMASLRFEWPASGALRWFSWLIG